MSPQPHPSTDSPAPTQNSSLAGAGVESLLGQLWNIGNLLPPPTPSDAHNPHHTRHRTGSRRMSSTSEGYPGAAALSRTGTAFGAVALPLALDAPTFFDFNAHFVIVQIPLHPSPSSSGGSGGGRIWSLAAAAHALRWALWLQ
ncbi:hypothetical protein MSAN_02118900 [Mycena sanguinolenta]|uniref:Uncharacterized protein n=1 Tax=Mycena sanguinolenta TaxID=230812 RepID=A0A8H6XI77_9AGAR|nr:hypothetical protein MSAN_02118900 [Mycena sanguinolenta]